MIKHIVMWNVRGQDAQEKAQGIARLKQAFEGLRGQIPGICLLYTSDAADD